MHELSDGIWQLTGPDLRMFGVVRIPARSTVLRLGDGLLVYSPIAFTDADAAAIEAHGEVAHIVAPSMLHHLFAVAAATRWPRATVHAAPGVATKQPDLRVDRELASGAGWDGVEVEVIAGAPSNNEAVLFHRASRTLVCADLVFNFPAKTNLASRLAFAMTGVGGGRLAQTREWKFFVKDRAAARASKERILAWPTERVAPCHGEPVAIDAASLANVMNRLG